MNFIDIFIIVFLLIGFALGYKDGIVRKIIGLLGIIAGIYFSIKFSDQFAYVLVPIFNNDHYFSRIVAFLLIFIVSIFIAAILKRIIHPFDRINKFINQILGGITGTIQMIVYLSAGLVVLSLFSFPSDLQKNESKFYSGVYNVIPSAIDFFLGNNIEKKKIFRNFIESKDSLTIPDVIDSTEIDSSEINVNDSLSISKEIIE